MKMQHIVALMSALFLIVCFVGCSGSTQDASPPTTEPVSAAESAPTEESTAAPETTAPMTEPATAPSTEPSPVIQGVELLEARAGVNTMAGYVFYDVSIDQDLWQDATNEERDALARTIVLEYDIYGLNAGYDEDHTVVTATVENDMVMGEEDLEDGLQITVFDSNTAASARRITLAEPEVQAPDPTQPPAVSSSSESSQANISPTVPIQESSAATQSIMLPTSPPTSETESSQLDFFDELSDDSDTQPADKVEGMVYWTEGGKSYHNSQDCVTLKRSKNILSGTLSQAQSARKADPCNICVG